MNSMRSAIFYVLFLFWCLCPFCLWMTSLVSFLYLCHMMQKMVKKCGLGETIFFFVTPDVYHFFQMNRISTHKKKYRDVRMEQNFIQHCIMKNTIEI